MFALFNVVNPREPHSTIRDYEMLLLHCISLHFKIYQNHKISRTAIQRKFLLGSLPNFRVAIFPILFLGVFFFLAAWQIFLRWFVFREKYICHTPRAMYLSDEWFARYPSARPTSWQWKHRMNRSSRFSCVETALTSCVWLCVEVKWRYTCGYTLL